MKKLSSLFLSIVMSFYGFSALTPALVYADNNGRNQNNQKELVLENESNHGAAVSAVARSHDDDNDRNHGQVVRDVARDNRGHDDDNDRGPNRGHEKDDGDDDNDHEDGDDDNNVIANVSTNPATGITSANAILNGKNGPVNATGHSFWVSLSPIVTSSPIIPAGVYSTPDLGAIAANTAFSASLSSLTTSGVPGNLPAITPNTKYYFVAWSLVGGTWYPGSVLSFTTASTSLPGALSAEDFGVVNYDTGLGILKGYTAGFGVTDATLAGASSVVVRLYAAGNVLLQTNTAILPKFNADITGAQFSSPFDVSGNFNYVSDGYWTNVRQAQYGQSVPAVKVVATVTLANGKVVTAENTLLTGDPTTIYPPAPVPVAPVISGVAANNISTTSANIVWNTDIPSNSKVWYSTANPVVIGAGTPSISLASLLMSHNLPLSGLMANTTYYFLVVSTNSTGQTSTSTQFSFTTAAVVPSYTLAQVATHNTQANCWTAIGGNVYDLTSYISSHPAGAGSISLLCGIDGTSLFNAQHVGDPNPAAILVGLKIGTLAI